VLSARHRMYNVQLGVIRVRLRSIKSISNVLVWMLILATAAFLYAVYRSVRVGLQDAEKRQMTLAIPILQSISAWEGASNQRRTKMDNDILRQRD